MRRGLILLAFLMVMAPPAVAHTQAERDAWYNDWIRRVLEAGDPSIELMEELQDFAARHPGFHSPLPPPTPRQTSPTATKTAPGATDATFRGMGAGVEQWRGLVAVYFPEQVDQALRVMSCESGGNPNAYNPSGASGLMQVLASWADNFGYVPAQLFDPAINLAVSRILYDDGGWRHWRASQHCWG